MLTALPSSLSFTFTPSASPSFPLSVCSSTSPPFVFPSFPSSSSPHSPSLSLTSAPLLGPPSTQKGTVVFISKRVNVRTTRYRENHVCQGRQWDENLSTAVRRGGRKGGSVCLFLLLFLLLRCFLLLLLTSISLPPPLSLPPLPPPSTFLFHPSSSESCSSLWYGLCYHDGRGCGTPRQGGGDRHAQSV